MMKRNNSRLRRILILDIIAVALAIATFTPLVIPQNQISPKLAGISYTMWVGVLVSILFVLLAYLASRWQQKDLHDH